MNIKPTLVVLAAGMGSRYGGLKQMDGFGPNGETIIDYSLYDAIQAGFGKIVFIIRSSFQEAFIQRFDPLLKDVVKVEYVCQETHLVPDDVSYFPERTKPWGTGHALWVARHVLNEPFGVINADDFYGREAMFQLANFLTYDITPNYAVIAYQLNKTISEHGTVNRGVCSVKNGKLASIEECIKIGWADGKISYPTEAGEVVLAPNTPVSMNMWAFKASYMTYTDQLIRSFFADHGMEEKSELYIPKIVDYIIQEELLDVDVIVTESQWVGVTYPEDKPYVSEALNKLIQEGVYKEKLWS